MEKKIYRYEVGIVQKLAGHNEPVFLGGFKSLCHAFDHIDKSSGNDGVIINGEHVLVEENIAVEEYIEYEDGQEICNTFPIKEKPAEPYIEAVTAYRCEDEDAPYLWRIKYKNGNVKDVFRMCSKPDDDVIGFMKSAASHVTHNVLTHEYETAYRAS